MSSGPGMRIWINRWLVNWNMEYLCVLESLKKLVKYKGKVLEDMPWESSTLSNVCLDLSKMQAKRCYCGLSRCSLKYSNSNQRRGSIHLRMHAGTHNACLWWSWSGYQVVSLCDWERGCMLKLSKQEMARDQRNYLELK